MKHTVLRGTFSLDAATLMDIAQLAARWGVGKSEVIRRSVRVASEHSSELFPDRSSPKEALRQLQKDFPLTPKGRAAWKESVLKERMAVARMRS